MATTKQHRFTKEQVKELQQTFNWYDKDNDNCVELKEIPNVIQTAIGLKWTQEMCLQLIQEFNPSILDAFAAKKSSKPAAAITAPTTTTSTTDKQDTKPTQGTNTGFAELPVPFDTYLLMLDSKMIASEEDDILLEEAFKKFDANDSKIVAPAELRLMFKTMLGENITLEEAMAMIDDVDVDRDGCLNFTEFKVHFIS